MKTVENRWMRVDTPGTTIEGWDFTGTMIISAPNVTVSESAIRPANASWVPPIWLKPGADDFTLADSKVLPPADEKITAPAGIMLSEVDGATIDGSVITGAIDGIKLVGSELLVTDTKIMVELVPGSHHDGIQIQASPRPTNLTLARVRIDGPPSPEGNAGIFSKGASGLVSATDVFIEGFGRGFSARDGLMHVQLNDSVNCFSSYGLATVQGGATCSEYTDR